MRGINPVRVPSRLKPFRAEPNGEEWVKVLLKTSIKLTGINKKE